MIYINALELIDLSVKNNVLEEIEGQIAVYKNKTAKNKEGWYLTEKDTLAKELMNDKEGQKLLIEALKERNVDFVPTDYSWLSKRIQ